MPTHVISPPPLLPLDDAIALIDISPDHLLSFFDYDPSATLVGYPDPSFLLPLNEEETAASPPLEIAPVEASLHLPQQKRGGRPKKYSSKACVGCRSKKQRCEDGRPCYRCINSRTRCIDDAYPVRRRTVEGVGVVSDSSEYFV
eukprot:758021-Hanusia_phi.AAC.1